MSRENVEVAQAVIAALNAGNVQALRELYHPDAIMLAPAQTVSESALIAPASR
jgi:ketosteroid isomerase-like protein